MRVGRSTATALLCLAVAAACPGLSAQGQTAWPEDATQCARDLRNPDVEIHHCTAATRAGMLADDNLAVTLNNRGGAYGAAGEPGKAIEDFDAALQIRPGDTGILANRETAQLAAGRADAALDDYDRIIAAGKEPDPAWLVGRGNARGLKGDIRGAVADYDAAIARRADWWLPWFNRGAAKSRAGRDVDALSDYTQAIGLAPGELPVRYNRGTTLLRLDRPAEAIADLDAVLAADPKNADALGNRAIAHERLGHSSEAIADFRRLWELGRRPEWLAAKLRGPGG